MSIVLSALSVAFAAFVVWLMVRIVNRRERWAKWTAVVLVVLFVGYPASVGPVLWLGYRDLLPDPQSDYVMKRAYRPLIWILDHAPERFGEAYLWYLEQWKPERYP